MGESGVVYRLEAWFAYSATGPLGVAPCQHEGVYCEDFANPQEAEHLLESLKAGPFLVRYNPSAADDHFVDPYRDVREAEPSR